MFISQQISLQIGIVSGLEIDSKPRHGTCVEFTLEEDS